MTAEQQGSEGEGEGEERESMYTVKGLPFSGMMCSVPRMTAT